VNKVTSALTLTIVGNVKQILVIMMAFVIFQTPLTRLNFLGIAIVTIGSGWYSYIGYIESLKPQMDAARKKDVIDEFPEKNSLNVTQNISLISPLNHAPVSPVEISIDITTKQGERSS